MANEMLFSSLTTDARVTALIALSFLYMYEDPAALPSSPAFNYRGSIVGQPGKTIQTPLYGHGGDEFGDTAEGSSSSNTAIATDNVSVTVARKTLQREVGDLAIMTDVHGAFDPTALAADAMGGWGRTFISLVAGVIDGYTATVTASSTMDLATHQAAVEKLIAAGKRPVVAIYHSVQWGQLQTDLTTNAHGRVTFQEATDELVRVKGDGYQGNLNGVDIFASDLVTDAGGKYKGAILAKNAVVWADGETPITDPNNQVPIGDKVVLERARDASAGETKYVYSAWIGVTMGIDEAGVTVLSDS